MAPWEYEFAPSFINGGHFHVTDPGPLHAPILDFSIRRDEDLELVLETQAPSDAKSAAIERSSGTIRITTEWVELENAGGLKAKLSGVVPFSKRIYDNYETGEGKLVEKARIHELEVTIPEAVQPAYTIEWLENLPIEPFIWPGFVKTKTETKKTRTIELGDEGLTLLSEESGQSSTRAAAKIVVAGAEVYVCALHREDSKGFIKPGCIVYRGKPDDDFRKKLRLALSFALNVYLVELGSAVLSEDWHIVSFKARSAYSIDRKVFGLPVLMPAPLDPRFVHGLDRVRLTRLMNAIVDKYELLDFPDLSWAYWHALCAAPHIASVHFGAAIELLLRQYAATKPDRFRRKIIDGASIWDRFSAQVSEAVAALEISQEKKDAIQKNVGGLNRVHQRDFIDSVLKDLGIALGPDEIRAWQRRNEAAHGIAMEAGAELDVIRDIKLLKVMFHRMLLCIVNGADDYTDYVTPGFPIRKLAEPVPPPTA